MKKAARSFIGVDSWRMMPAIGSVARSKLARVQALQGTFTVLARSRTMATATARENCLLRNRPSTACQNQILRGVSSAIGGSSVRLSLNPKSMSPASPQSVDDSRPLRASSVDAGAGVSGARIRLRPPEPGDSKECQSGSLVVFVTASRLGNSGSTNTGIGEVPAAATAMARFCRESSRAGVSWILGRRSGARRSALMCGKEAGFSSWRSSFGSSRRNVSTAQN